MVQIKQGFRRKVIISLGVLGSILSLSLTSLRLSDNIGFGELIIIVSFLYYILNFRGIIDNSKFAKPTKFVMLFFLFLLSGFIYTSIFIYQLQTDEYFVGVVRTFIAYLFSITNALLVAKMISEEMDFIFLVKSVVFYFTLVVGISILLQFPQFLDCLLSSGARFYGFSKNPNQLGSLAAVIPFSVLYLKQKKQIGLFYTIFSLGVLLLLSFAIKSDALFYGLIFSSGLYFILNFRNLNFEKRVVLFVVVLFIFINYVYDALFLYIEKTNMEGDQSDVRYLLWNNAIEGIQSSPLLGFGPGSFSGLTGPFQGAESHNTFIDLSTNIGILGLIIFISLLSKIFYKLYGLNEKFLILVLSSILVFGFFHNILRHPLFWIILFSLYTISSKKNVSINYNSSL